MSAFYGLFRIAASAVVTALVIAACAPRPEPEGEPETTDNGDPAPDQNAEPQASGQDAASARLEIAPDVILILDVATEEPRADAPIEFSLTVSNGGADELVIDFPDGQRFDFEVIREGESVWRWAADMFFPQMLGRERIASGDRKRWTATLESGLAAGSYTVRGTLTTNTRHAVDLAFRVEEGSDPR